MPMLYSLYVPFLINIVSNGCAFSTAFVTVEVSQDEHTSIVVCAIQVAMEQNKNKMVCKNRFFMTKQKYKVE